VAALGLDAERLNAAGTDGVSSGEISSDGMKSVATGSSEIGLGGVARNGIGLDEIRHAPHRLAALSPEMEASRAAAKQFLYANLYNSPGMEETHTHASQVVEELFSALIADPGLMPADHQAEIPAEGLVRTVADYIAGMTDSYIEQAWQHCGGR
jgi:dGTP triphosphohydrolase